MTLATQTKTLAVIGAGIVGVSTALVLQRDGHRVLLFDGAKPGTGTSFGNAGSIAIGGVYPTGSPGNWKQVPKMLSDPMSALKIRPSYLPRMIPWLTRFLLESRPERVAVIAGNMARLLDGAGEAHRRLARLSKAEDILRPIGWLKVYSSEAKFNATADERRVMAEHGIKVDVLNADEIRQLEPALSHRFTHGYNQPNNDFVVEPLRLTEVYLEAFFQAGGLWQPEAVREFRIEGGKVTKVVADRGIYPVDGVVITAGALSAALVSSLGDRVLLDTERGYHLNLKVHDGPVPRMPVVIGDQGYVLAPMSDGLRLTAGVEFAGLKAAPDFTRIRRLLPLVQDVLPGLKAEVTREWMGFRPSTPDSMPVIGPSGKLGNVWYGFGHGHLGLTLAARTAELLAAMIAGRPPAIDMQAFGIARF